MMAPRHSVRRIVLYLFRVERELPHRISSVIELRDLNALPSNRR